MSAFYLWEVDVKLEGIWDSSCNKAFLIPDEESGDDNDKNERTANEELTNMEDATTPSFNASADSANRKEFQVDSDTDLEFYLTDEKGTTRDSRIVMNEPVAAKAVPGRLSVLVCWPSKMVKKYKSRLLSSLPQEEPLGPEDMWSLAIIMGAWEGVIILPLSIASKYAKLPWYAPKYGFGDAGRFTNSGEKLTKLNKNLNISNNEQTYKLNMLNIFKIIHNIFLHRSAPRLQVTSAH
ncbi:unnamed protein product [Thlaspi arvense]|uniref:Uncharacterized protein n=1 Tax=Thlaspi arvense TaxID=13288 RepID=A0AAU9SCU1_THLAR|nr:unnamed protein product [Thlaspi arvense]